MQRPRRRAIAASFVLAAAGLSAVAVGSAPLEAGALPGNSFGVMSVPTGDAMPTSGYFRIGDDGGETVTVSGTAAGFIITMGGGSNPTFTVDIAPRTGTTFAATTTTHREPVARATASTVAARFVVAQGAAVCADQRSEFQINDLAFDGGGNVSRVAVAWSGQCFSVPGAPLQSGFAYVNETPGPIGNPTVSEFYPLTPKRLLDTRDSGRLGAGGTTNVVVAGGSSTVPANATAVVLNVTAVSPTTSTFLTVYPAGTALPFASNVNPVANDIVPNLATVKVGSGGAVTLFNAVGSTDALVDVVGYYLPDADINNTAGGRFFGQTPNRILDTRGATPFGPGESRDLLIDAGATAAILNVTATESTATSSYLTVYPQGEALPTASNLNFSQSQTIPNLVVVKLNAGKASIFNAAGNTHVIVDVVGLFKTVAAGNTTGRFLPIDPLRAYDTRNPAPQGTLVTLPLGPNEDRSVTPVGLTDHYPFEFKGYVANVTVTNTTGSGYLTVFPDGTARPVASNLNWNAGETHPNLVMIGTDAYGYTRHYNAVGSTDLVIDLAGWYTR